jgi:hypothetical protein
MEPHLMGLPRSVLTDLLFYRLGGRVGHKTFNLYVLGDVLNLIRC